MPETDISNVGNLGALALLLEDDLIEDFSGAVDSMGFQLLKFLDLCDLIIEVRLLTLE